MKMKSLTPIEEAYLKCQQLILNGTPLHGDLYYSLQHIVDGLLHLGECACVMNVWKTIMLCESVCVLQSIAQYFIKQWCTIHRSTYCNQLCALEFIERSRDTNLTSQAADNYGSVPPSLPPTKLRFLCLSLSSSFCLAPQYSLQQIFK